MSTPPLGIFASSIHSVIQVRSANRILVLATRATPPALVHAALVGRENIRLPLARAAAVLATTESTRLRQQGPRIATTAREAQ